ncbi:MAG: RibD family protein [Alphaproteobacteria bacterium]|nr:RibD family protein [Alphaproteobacteria bacterium]
MSQTTTDPLAPIRDADASKPFVVAQLGQSLDGRIATTTGESRWINRDAALDHLHSLRAHVDAVVVGIGTVLADDPGLNVRRVPLLKGKPQPARVVIDPSGRLPDNAKLLNDDGARRIVIHAADTNANPPCETFRLDRDKNQGLSPHDIVNALFAAGLKKLLIEGGAQTVSRFIDAGAIDRLHVLVAPMIIGSGKSGLDLAPIDKLDRALRPPTNVHVLHDGDVLFDCDFSPARATLSPKNP